MGRLLHTVTRPLLVVLAWCCLTSAAIAGVLADFSPLDGVVILATPDSCLIDRDQAAGVTEGDLFTVLGDGEELIHPVSGAKLGRRELRKGVVRVVRLHQGYAEAVPLGTMEAVVRGDRVRRFAGLTALFVDQSAGRGKGQYDELRTGLAHLRWEGYFGVMPDIVPSVKAPRLVFTVSAGGLEVREELSGLLRRYPFAAPAATVAVPVPPQTPSVAAEPWIGPSWSGRAAGVEVADLDGDGIQEVIVASEHALEIGRLRGRDYTRLGGSDYGLTTRILAIDSADGDGDGRPELWVTAAYGESLASFVVVWRGQALQPLARNLGWWFRALPLPGEGRVLLGQRLGDGENDFAGPLLRLSLKDEKVVAGAPLSIASSPPLYGLALLPVSPDPLTIRLGLGDLLQVDAASGDKLWESNDPYGGSELFFERPDPTRLKDGDTRHAYAAPRLEVRDSRSLLVPVNEGRRSVARRREFNRSHLELLRWDGVALRSQWSSRSESGYLVDYRLADVDNDGSSEIAQLVVYVRPGFSSKGKFALLIDKSLP